MPLPTNLGEPDRNPERRVPPVKPLPQKRPDNRLPDFGLPPMRKPKPAPSREDFELPLDDELLDLPEEKFEEPKEEKSFFDDDPFESISLDEVYEEDAFEEEEVIPAAPSEPLRRPREYQSREEQTSYVKQQEKPQEVDYSSDEDEDDDEDEIVIIDDRPKKKKQPRKMIALPDEEFSTNDEFVNEKTMKVLPLGVKKGQKVKVKASDFDKRKNLQKQAKIVMMGVMSGVILLAGVGLYKTFKPDDSLTPEQASSIALQTFEDYGFPYEGGRAFAEDFAKAYLTVTPDDAAGRKMLNYFYNGDFENSAITNISVDANFKQVIAYDPQVVEEIRLEEYSTRYIVTTAVRKGNVKDGIPVNRDDKNIKWVNLSINVYYDSETRKFSVASDPALVPELSHSGKTNIPAGLEPGLPSDAAYDSAVKSVVYEFVKGFSKSSPSNTQAIEQYIKPEYDGAIESGFSGQFVLASSDTESIQYTVFLDRQSPDGSVLKVLTKVDWKDVESPITYKSEYIMTLVKENDKYLVSKFQPYNYRKSEN